MHTEDIEYTDGETDMVGFVAHDPSIKGKKPAVIVVHAFEGRNQLACQYAKDLAALGYVGFAVDMYGEKKLGKNLEECMSFIKPLFGDRKKLRKRMHAGFEAVSSMDQVDDTRIGAIGFCFGGLCVLDLVRMGAQVKDVVSVHGVLMPAQGIPNEKIKAKVLAFHGHKDPQIPEEQIKGFMKEMDDAHVDWQMHFYGNAKHAFTDPEASKIGPPEMGREYNPAAAQRAWGSSVNFFKEIFR